MTDFVLNVNSSNFVLKQPRVMIRLTPLPVTQIYCVVQ
jgi:hypothetical protein